MSGGDEASGPVDLTLIILREIRDEIRGLRDDGDKTRVEVRSIADRLDETNARLDQTNARLDRTNARLDETQERMDRGFATLGRKLDAVGKRIDRILVGPVGETVRDLTRRMTVLERRVDDLTGSER